MFLPGDVRLGPPKSAHSSQEDHADQVGLFLTVGES